MQTEHTDLLAPWTYSSREFFNLEVQQLFKANWLLVGHISDFSRPGDYLTFDAFDEQVIVVLDSDRKLNAFHNICQHRGARLAPAKSGHCPRAIICPFHGWSYGLDGKLRGVPAAATFSNLDKKSISLKPVEHEVWMGFVFIRLRGEGESLQNQLAPIEHEISPYLPEQLQPLYPASEELKPFNWKTIHDIDNEGYHVPVGHPSLQQLYGHDYTDSEQDGFLVSRGTVSERPAKAWSVRHYQRLLPQFDHLPPQRQKLWFYFQLFPNLIFGFYPDMMEIYMTLPVSPVSTRYLSRTYALPDARPEVRAARYLNVRINNETSQEDDAFIGQLQNAMKSSAWSPPRLSSLEEGVRLYHHRIQQNLPVSRLLHAPPESEIASVNAHMGAASAGA